MGLCSDGTITIECLVHVWTSAISPIGEKAVKHFVVETPFSSNQDKVGPSSNHG